MAEPEPVSPVLPSPTPLTISVQTAGSTHIVLVFSHAAGSGVYFVEVAAARWLRDQLTEQVSGIVIPTNGQLHREEQ